MAREGERGRGKKEMQERVVKELLTVDSIPLFRRADWSRERICAMRSGYGCLRWAGRAFHRQLRGFRKKKGRKRRKNARMEYANCANVDSVSLAGTRTPSFIRIDTLARCFPILFDINLHVAWNTVAAQTLLTMLFRKAVIKWKTSGLIRSKICSICFSF